MASDRAQAQDLRIDLVQGLMEIMMYERILVPVDGSATSVLGLNEAIKLAANQGARLRLLHIVNEFVFDSSYSSGLYSDTLVEALRLNGQKTLAKMAAMAREQGVEPQTVLEESIGGIAGDLIVEQAAKWPADLIVMGTHGRRGIRRLVLGSDAESVIRSSVVPVLLVRVGPASTEGKSAALAATT